MTRPKKQHYVPQFILRKFGSGSAKNPKLWALDKKHQAVRFCSVRDVAHENRFYEASNENGRRLEFEGLMEHMDSIGSDVVHRVLAGGVFRLTPKDMVWISYFIACQMIRTPMARNDAANLLKMIINKWGPGIYFENGKKPVGEYTSEDIKRSSLACIRNLPDMAKQLQAKVWVLSRAPSKCSFVIGDNPVTRHNRMDHGPRGSLGLNSHGIEMYMPLSPELSLHILCPRLAESVCRHPVFGSAYRQAVAVGSPVLLLPQQVEFLNSLQASWSERFVFGQNRADLDMPLDMLRTNPELIDGPGVRPSPVDGLSQIGPMPE